MCSKAVYLVTMFDVPEFKRQITNFNSCESVTTSNQNSNQTLKGYWKDTDF